MQPDRACYIERAADADLGRGIAEQRFCYVLSSRATGKSSLMARAIRSLRRDGRLAAVVDLNQIGTRGESSDAGRWFYGIAYRILRELRLKVDLQAWWQEKSALTGEQRLSEFLWEVVLANTSAPVTVFFDEIERVLDLPFAQELFATIHACYARRISEPDYARLNFVVLGVAAEAQLCPDQNLSPFIDGQAITLADFTVQECLHLAPGFRCRRAEASVLLERIHEWTGGHPYLTQKVARGVVRRGGKPQDVERTVREQFLSPSAAQSEPLLSHMRAMLTQPGGKTRQALTVLARIAKGTPIAADAASAPRELLRLSGIVAIDHNGLLHYRNRLFREVFTPRWIGGARPFDWRGMGAVAALLAVAAIVTVWYSQYLPRPYIQTLSVVTQDFAVAQDAYDKLHRLPGFARTADRLLAEAMARRSREAESYAEMRSADEVLRRLPEGARLADRLQADYWLRRAVAATHAEQRDQALLFAMQALPGREDQVRRIAAELIGKDYPRLTGSFRLSGPPAHWAVNWSEQRLTVVDQAHRAERLPLAGPRTGGDQLAPVRIPGRLTALQHVPVRREISVEDTGSAGRFRLELRVQHPGIDDLLLTVTAPSGASASLPLHQQSPGQEIYSFTATGSSRLLSLADEARQGVWRLTLVDRQSGGVGTLLSWGLQFSETGEEWRDAPEQGVAIPDPVRTEQVRIQISADGRYAVAQPARAGAVGALAVWNIADGRLVHDLHMPSVPDYVAFNADATRLLVQAGDTLTLWDVETGVPVASLETQTQFLLPPALSVDGDLVAIAERVDGAAPLFSLLRVSDGTLVASSEGMAGVRDWVLGPQARYLATLAAPRVVTVLDPRLGKTLRSLDHERDVQRLIPVPAQDLLLTVDAAGDIRAWRLPVDSTDAAAADNWRLGVTADPASVSVSADGSMAAFEGPQERVVVRDIGGDLRPLNLRIDASERPVETGVSPDGTRLVTVTDSVFRLWSLEPRTLGAGPNLNISALALDDGGGLAALGFRGGHVRVRSAGELERASAQSTTVDYIGHRGSVTSLDIDLARNLIASGGEDGVVRVWDVASVAPGEHFMRHPQGPIGAVEISPDGRWIASAAEYSARIWQTRTGKLSTEVPVNGAALAVDFSPDSKRWAVGDSAGNVFVGSPGGADAIGSVRAQGAVQAIAFSPDGRLLASGDAIGNVELWNTVTFEPVGRPYELPHAVRWLGFGAAGAYLLIQTDHWMQRAAIDDGDLDIIQSRLLDVGLEAGAAFVDPGGEKLRMLGGRGAGQPAIFDLEMASPAAEPLPSDSPLLARDWTAVLGLSIDDSGEIVPTYR